MPTCTCSPNVLEAVDELERRGVEDRELLLDGDGEVTALLVGLPRAREQLLVRKLLLLAHPRRRLPGGAVSSYTRDRRALAPRPPVADRRCRRPRPRLDDRSRDLRGA